MIGAPVACLQLLTNSHIEAIKIMKEKKERDFGSLMRVWELGREKHERSLKPRLSAADCSGTEKIFQICCVVWCGVNGFNSL